MAKIVTKTALLEYSAADMFNLVDDIEHYPQFLPWCTRSELIARTEQKTVATLWVGYQGAHAQFCTENDKVIPQSMDMRLLSGPFRRFHGRWRFQPLEGNACKIDFYLEYELQSGLLASLLGPVFARIADTLLDAFVRRAHQLFQATKPAADSQRISRT